mgnify:CR=1 FL=1
MNSEGSAQSNLLERWLITLVLGAVCSLPLAESAGRVFGITLPGSIPLVQHLTLAVAILGAALAAANGRLLALSTSELLPKRLSPPTRILTSAAGAAISVWLLAASVDLVRVEKEAANPVAWGINTWVFVALLPVGFAWIAGRLVWHSGASWAGRLLAFAIMAVLLAAFHRPEAIPSAALPVLLGAVGLATLLGMPIFAGIGGAALLLSVKEAMPAASVPSEMYRLTASPMLPSLPLFTFAGFILSESGASRRLMRLFTALVGWLPGGLAIMTVLLLAFFTPFTGASGITILSMGGLLLPMLLKEGYPEPASIGLVTVSGSIGLLFPPSLPVILYGIAAQTPIDSLFVAGIVPGFILVASVALWGAWKGWRSGAPRTPFHGKDLASAAWEAKWELLLPVVVLGGIFGGYTTLVEASAITVLYAFLAECVLHRDLSVSAGVPRVAVESATLVGGFLVILGVAMGFTNYLIQAEIPMQLLAWVRSHIHSPWVFLLALNAFLLLVGAAMDIYSAILVIVPLITPLGAAYGISPVHMGIVFLANMELGYLTPPMGENLFLSAFRFRQPLARIFASAVPYWLMLAGAVLVITYLPLLF